MDEETYVRMARLFDYFRDNPYADKAQAIRKLAPFVPVEIYTGLDEGQSFDAIMGYVRSQMAAQSNPSGPKPAPGSNTTGSGMGGLFKQVLGKNDAAGFVTDWVKANRR
jgi:hypothetical protein